MSALEHRLQVLLDEDRYQRVKTQAALEGMSVGAMIRRAIDLAWPVDEAAVRRKAGERLLETSAQTTPGAREPDWEEHKYDDLDGQGERLHGAGPVR